MSNSIQRIRRYFLNDIFREVPERHEGEPEKESQSSSELRQQRVERIAVDLLHDRQHVGGEGYAKCHDGWISFGTVFCRLLKNDHLFISISLHVRIRTVQHLGNN